ncbi:hypothetical protein GCM10029992_11140 [Glycomyces albus]
MDDQYIGEFFDEPSETVFSVFRITSVPGLFKVTGYDGANATVVCTFHPGTEPEWIGHWQHHERRSAINAEATRIAREEPADR